MSAFPLRLVMIGGMGLLGNFVPATMAQEPKTAEPIKGKWMPLLQKHASECTIETTAKDGTKTTATQMPEPIMRWTQPVRGGDDGVLCLWTNRGRPVAAITVFTFKGDDGKRWIVHEHSSLSELPLEGSWQGRVMWHADKPGIAFSPVPEAPTPADSPAGRMRQMQAILRDFSGSTIYKNAPGPLRPLTKPLYRYEKTGPEVLDGAMFGLVQGNDPEAFVLLEARPEGKETRWYYGVARLTDLALRVQLKGREVYSVPYTNAQPQGPYHNDVVVRKASETPEDFEKP